MVQRIDDLKVVRAVPDLFGARVPDGERTSAEREDLILVAVAVRIAIGGGYALAVIRQSSPSGPATEAIPSVM